jgi:nucleoid DNA-binding protein/nucleoid-associated protein YgaU
MKSDLSTLTTAVLAGRVGEKTGIDEEKVKLTINQLFAVIAEEISENESFRLLGFGTFKKIFVAASEGRNPQKNTPIEIPSHYKVKFSPASALAARINKPYADLKPQIINENNAVKTAVPEQAAVQEVSAAEPPAAEKAPVPPQQAENGDKTSIYVPHEQVPPVVNQTVQNAVIEQQIIHQQIIHQQILNQTVPEKKHTAQAEDDFDPDYDTDDDDSEKYVNRCWFFAGTAVVLTAFVLVFFVLAVIHGTGKNAVFKTAQATSVKETHPPVQHVSGQIRVAADDNLYAGLSGAQYGVRNLWPYIFSANMLRYPDPDRPGAADKLIIPAKPDKAIDRSDIELSVIDVYDAYRALIGKQPEGRAAKLRREHAVTALICGETLYTGFIGRYAPRFDPADVKTAEEQIRKAAAR